MGHVRLRRSRAKRLHGSFWVSGRRYHKEDLKIWIPNWSQSSVLIFFLSTQCLLPLSNSLHPSFFFFFFYRFSNKDNVDEYFNSCSFDLSNFYCRIIANFNPFRYFKSIKRFLINFFSFAKPNLSNFQLH